MVQRAISQIPALLLLNIRQLVTLRSPSRKPGPRRGPELNDLGIIKDGAVLCVGGRLFSVPKPKTPCPIPGLRRTGRKILESICAGRWSWRVLWVRHTTRFLGNR